jgi:hypothetical protein
MLKYSFLYFVTSVSKTAPTLLQDCMKPNSRINQTQASACMERIYVLFGLKQSW